MAGEQQLPAEGSMYQFVEAGSLFYAIKLDKHYAFSNSTQTAASCGQPGDYLVMDSFFNVLVFDRKQFQKCFGHKRMELLDK